MFKLIIEGNHVSLQASGWLLVFIGIFLVLSIIHTGLKIYKHYIEIKLKRRKT